MAVWVSKVDKAAVRFTQDVDILVRRTEFDGVRTALEAAGIAHRDAAGLEIFLDGATGKPRDAVHIIYAGEKVKLHETAATPDVSESEIAGHYTVISLPALVQIELTAFRDKGRTHLRDLIDVGLLDATWPARFTPNLGAQLQLLLDTPEG